MVVGRIRQYKARQVSLYHLINRGNSNLACTCTVQSNLHFGAGWAGLALLLSRVPPLHHCPVLLRILPGAEGVGDLRGRLLLVDGDGYLEGLVHVVVLVELEGRGEAVEGSGEEALSLSLESSGFCCERWTNEESDTWTVKKTNIKILHVHVHENTNDTISIKISGMGLYVYACTLYMYIRMYMYLLNISRQLACMKLGRREKYRPIQYCWAGCLGYPVHTCHLPIDIQKIYCSAQTGQHSHLQRSCCPVWALQHIYTSTCTCIKLKCFTELQHMYMYMYMYHVPVRYFLE